MALRKKKSNAEADPESPPSTLDRLTDLRNDIKGQDGLTQLLDILIDAEGGDSAALADERALLDDTDRDGDDADAGADAGG